MPYVAPTVDDMKARYPEFKDVEVSIVQAALDEAATRVDKSWREADFQNARMLYAGHVLTLAGQGSSREAKFAGLAAAGISQIKISSLSVTLAKDGFYSRNPIRAGELSSTSYGTRFMALMRLNFPAILVV